MSDIPPARENIQIEAVQFRAAVSENILQTTGASINFINDYQFDSREFPLNGPYNIVASPQTAVEGYWIAPFNIEIFQVAMWNVVAGSSGTTELDIKRATTSGGSFATIFTTTPKITSGAGSGVWIRTGGSGSGLTAPVLTSTPFSINAGDAIRLDKITAQVAGENCGLIIYFRPIDP